MTLLTAEKLARTYLIVVLVLSVIVASPLQLGISAALLAIQLYSAYKQPKPNLHLTLTFASIILAPIVFEAIAGEIAAVTLTIPTILMLDHALKKFTLTQSYSFNRIGRNISNTLKLLSVSLTIIFLITLVTANLTLLLSTTLLIAYLTAATINTLTKIPKKPLQESNSWTRIVVGNSENTEVQIQAKTALPTYVSLEPVDTWVSLEPSNYRINPKSETKFNIKFTPPLAGPTKIQIKASLIDPRGLIQTGQILEPLNLSIIPKAKYASWLANKFLEQTTPGGGMAIAIPHPSSKPASSGVEFYSIRPYQPGDTQKDIDWKHTYMLSELIVKQYTGTQGQVGIIAANLTAKNPQDADILAYNLVMTALTLATEGLPSALAVYNDKEVLAATHLMNPREILKQALQLTEKIAIIEQKQKVLQSIETRRLKRSIEQLSKIGSESAAKLEKLLEFEIEAKAMATKNQPATEALTKVTDNLQGRAVITVISGMDAPSEALLLTLEKLQEQGHSIIKLK